jgi:hypothetical protein
MHAFDGRLPPGRRLRKGYYGAWPMPVEEMRKQHPTAFHRIGERLAD